MKKLKINILFTLIIFSCSEQKSKNISEDFMIFSERSINFEDETKLVQLSQITKDPPKFIFLETTENSLIGRIDKVIVYENLIFVLDTFIAEAVLIFNLDGKFIKKLATQGEGPDQYKKPLDIFIENGQIWILDDGREIKVFDLKGSLIDNFKLHSFSAIRFQKLNESDIFSFVSGNIDDNLIVADENFNRIHSYFPYIDRETDMVILNSMFRTYDSGEIIYRRNYNDTLYSIKKDGSIRPYKFINYGENGIDYLKILNLMSSNNQKDLLGKYAYTTFFSENLNSEFLVFSYKDDFWINIFDKKNESSVLFRYSNYQNDITLEKDFGLIGTTANEIIFQVSPQSLITNREKILSNNLKGFSPEFFQSIKHLERDDNPILMFVKFDLSSSD